MEKLDQFGFFQLMGVAVLLGVANLKNLPITVQAGVLISRGPGWDEGKLFWIFTFLLICASGVGGCSDFSEVSRESAAAMAPMVEAAQW